MYRRCVCCERCSANKLPANGFHSDFSTWTIGILYNQYNKGPGASLMNQPKIMFSPQVFPFKFRKLVANIMICLLN